MRINSNIPALNTHRMLNRNTSSLQKALERLSSGNRINRAADDAAGLAISEKMKAQIQGLRQASRNALDGISLVQTAEGALDEVHSMLQRMRELSVQGANEVYMEDDLGAILDEMKQLTEQIDKISEETKFNGVELFKGEEDGKLHLQVGANEGEHIVLNMEDYKIDIEDLDGANIESIVDREMIESDDFNEAIEIYDKAISYISKVRSKLGAIQNRLESTVANVDNTAENLTAARSRIYDLDMALEMSNFTKLQVLQQAGTSMLSEANSLPQSVLQLLQG